MLFDARSKRCAKRGPPRHDKNRVETRKRIRASSGDGSSRSRARPARHQNRFTMSKSFAQNRVIVRRKRTVGFYFMRTPHETLRCAARPRVVRRNREFFPDDTIRPWSVCIIPEESARRDERSPPAGNAAILADLHSQERARRMRAVPVKCDFARTETHRFRHLPVLMATRPVDDGEQHAHSDLKRP